MTICSRTALLKILCTPFLLFLTVFITFFFPSSRDQISTQIIFEDSMKNVPLQLESRIPVHILDVTDDVLYLIHQQDLRSFQRESGKKPSSSHSWWRRWTYDRFSTLNITSILDSFTPTLNFVYLESTWPIVVTSAWKRRVVASPVLERET